MRTDRNLYLTRDRERVVPADHPDATFLFAREGEVIGGRLVARYGLEATTKGKLKVSALKSEGDNGE